MQDVARLGGLIIAAKIAFALPAFAQVIPDCPVSGGGTVITCSGDQAAGVQLDTAGSAETLTTLNVENLTGDIVPAAGIEGVIFTGNQRVILSIDMGPWKIVTGSDGTPAVAAGNLTADDVDVHFAGRIVTTGDFAAGIVVYTPDGDQLIAAVGSITTEGQGSNAIFGTSETGDIVIESSADLRTTGPSASGIRAASEEGAISIIASGSILTDGGIGISAASETGDISIASDARIITFGNDAIGIQAETQADVMIGVSGAIETSGEDAMGVFARSFFGNVTLASTALISTEGYEAHGISIDAGGDIAAASIGSITTHGEGARGIFLQATGDAILGVAGSIQTFGDAADAVAVHADNDIVVIAAADITTMGNDAYGIYVESAQGAATVLSGGNITAHGTGSIGIAVSAELAASLTNFGTITGGSCCPGVMLTSGSEDTTLINFGSISALSGFAIDVSGTTNTIENYGTVTGDVSTFYGDTTFTNYASGQLNSGTLLYARTINHGTLAPGGAGAIETTLVMDSYAQSSTGRLAIDVDAQAGQSDALFVSDAAELAGTVVVSIIGAPRAPVQEYLILAAGTGVTDNGLGLLASPALHAKLLYPDADSVVLGIAVDYATSGLNGNQRALAGYLNQIAARLGWPHRIDGVLLGLLNTLGIDAYRDALDQLAPQIYGDAQIAAMYSSLAFSNALLSCKVNGNDTASIMREGQCLWAGASARFLDNDTTYEQTGFSEAAGLFTAGAQVALDDVWRLGFAAGYQSSLLSTPTNAQSDGSMAQAGVALKYNPGALLLAAALSGGGAWYDTTRPMDFGGFSSTADSNQRLGIFTGSLRAAYVFGAPHLYLKPAIDLALTSLNMGGFTESTANGAGLAVSGSSNTIFSLAPTLEAGSEWWLSNGTLVRPHLRGGLAWYEGADIDVAASFAVAPLADSFIISTGTGVGVDDVMGLVGAGVEVISGEDAVFRLSYDGQVGSNTQIHSIGIKGSSRF